MSAKSGLLYEKRLALKLVAEAAQEPGQQVRLRVSSLEERAGAYRVHRRAGQSDIAVCPQRYPYDSGSRGRPLPGSLADLQGFWGVNDQPNRVREMHGVLRRVLCSGWVILSGMARAAATANPTWRTPGGRGPGGEAAGQTRVWPRTPNVRMRSCAGPLLAQQTDLPPNPANGGADRHCCDDAGCGVWLAGDDRSMGTACCAPPVQLVLAAPRSPTPGLRRMPSRVSRIQCERTQSGGHVNTYARCSGAAGGQHTGLGAASH